MDEFYQLTVIFDERDEIYYFRCHQGAIDTQKTLKMLDFDSKIESLNFVD